MQFIHEFGPLDTTPLMNELAKQQQPFETSQLYNSTVGKKFVDESFRSSTFRAIVDNALFDAADSVVKQVSSSLREKTGKTALLLRNDVTHIRYPIGGFFKRHRDYLSLTSNFVEEYTLIICISDGTDTEGGETVLQINPELSHVSKATTTRNHALLFRKDMDHEGRKLLKGEKEIVTLNLWVTKKVCTKLLHIKFPPEDTNKNQHGMSSRRKRKLEHLQEVANDKTYVVNVDDLQNFPDCMLNGLLRFEESSSSVAITQSLSAVSEGSAQDEKAEDSQLGLEKELGLDEEQGNGVHGATSGALQIVTYVCHDCTYEEFETVWRIISGMRVTTERVARHKKVLNFFMIGVDFILVDEAKEDLDNADPAVQQQYLRGDEIVMDEAKFIYQKMLVEEGGREQLEEYGGTEEMDASHARMLELLAQYNQASATQTPPPPEDDGKCPDVILCSSHERTIVVADMAKKMDLPYVKFRVFFAEGTYQFGGDASFGNPGEVFRMVPVFCSIGDYDNILACRNMVSLGIDEFSFYRGKEEGGGGWRNEDNTWSAKVLNQEKYKLPQEELDNVMTPDTRIKLKLPKSKDYGSRNEPKSEVQEKSGAKDDEGDVVLLCESYLRGGVFWGLQVAKSSLSPGDVLEWISEEGVMENVPAVCTVLPGGNSFRESDDFANHSSLFHVDTTGNTCFSAQEAKTTISRLEELKFLEQVKNRIKDTVFHVSQKFDAIVDHAFCNEQVYGNLDLLMVTGLVRLEANSGSEEIVDASTSSSNSSSSSSSASSSSSSSSIQNTI